MSLRTRTTLLVAVVTAVLLVGGAVTLDAVLRHRLIGSADDLARSRVADLLTLAESGDLPRVLVNVTDDSVAQVVDEEGRVVAASANAAGAPPLTDDPATGGLQLEEIVGPDDDETEEYRLWTSTGPSAGGGRVRVYVGTSLESVREATQNLRSRAGGRRTPGVAAARRRLVAARRPGAAPPRPDPCRGRHHHRVRTCRGGSGTRDRRDEVGRLATTMNRMLERLEQASERQRRFIADVSHDLRSPLTAQRTQLEVAMAHPGSVDDGQLRADLLAHVDEMDSLVGDLLFVVTEDERPRHPSAAGPRGRRPGGGREGTPPRRSRRRHLARSRRHLSSATPASCGGWSATWSRTPMAHRRPDRAAGIERCGPASGST